MGPIKLPISIDSLLHGKAVEWERLEFKAGWNPLDVMHTLCAFANDFHNLGGGYILVGVAEQAGRPVLPPVGIETTQVSVIQKEILNLSHSAIQPHYHPIVVPEVVNGKHVLILWAPGGPTRPYKVKLGLGKDCKDWGYFIRKGSSTVRAKGADETELISLAATVPFDDRINQRASLDDLSRDLIVDFLNEVGSPLAKPAKKVSLADLGRQMNIMDGPKEALFPKNVGLLFFNPEPHRFFPATQIDVAWFPEGAGGDKFTEKIFRGPLARMIREALDYIRRNYISETVVKHPDRAEATRIENFPYAAIEEAVANAVYHRSYEEREPIEVRISKEELVVLSYPGPDRSVRLEQLRAGRALPRRYRNRRIGEFLKELDMTEGRATGIPKILHAMEQNGSPTPEFDFDKDHTFFMCRLPVHPKSKPPEVLPGPDSATPQVGAKSAPSRHQVEAPRSESRSESRSEWWRVRPEWRPEWRPESVHGRIMMAISSNPLARAEIANAIGHKAITGALRQALADLMNAGLVAYTIPEKPNSRLQRYRGTEKNP